jgi:hypothetical protein
VNFARPTVSRLRIPTKLLFLSTAAASLLFSASAEADYAKGPVYGTVKYADGRPAAGVIVRAFDYDGLSKNDFIGETRTDASGSYTIRIEAKHWDTAPDNITIWRPDVFVTVLRNVDGESVKVFHSKTHDDKPHRESLRIDAAIPVDRWVTGTTKFKPATHGWQFANRAYPVCWDTPRRICDNWSFCGGMSLSALERFRTARPIPAETTPSAATLEEVKRAQLLTMTEGVWKRFLEFTMSPSTPQTVAFNTIGSKTEQEVPKLRRAIDAGLPVILGLIRVDQSNRANDVFKNHQVLATGYRFNEGTGQMYIDIYDPNHPVPRSAMASRISLHTRLPENQIRAKQTTETSTGPVYEKVRGFFVIPMADLSVSGTEGLGTGTP